MAPGVDLLEVPVNPRIVLWSLVAAAACGRPDDAPGLPSERGTSPLEAAFDSAAKDYAVPASLLKAIAYVETRATGQAGLVSVSGSHGMLGIVERPDWQMGSRATALTGASIGQLDVDARANIHGGAAVLRELADKDPKSPLMLGDWYHAVSLYPGFDSPGIAADYAAQVFARLEAGFTSNTPEGSIVLAPTPSDWRRNAPAQAARQDALNGSDYPAASDFVASPNFVSGRASYTYIVIHDMEGTFSGTEGWFQQTMSMVSAHYIVRSSDGNIIQMVHDADTAWHVQCYNSKAIGIEHEGWESAPATWYTEAMYTESAKLTRWLADRYSVPLDRTHIIAHGEIPSSCNSNGHTDPGSGWNWTHYMDLVTNGASTGTTGVLTGVIYTGGNTNNRVAGATVSAGGQTVTADANGLYTLNLPAGMVTATATKAGYTTASVMRAVASGQTIWGSMDIDPAAATGTLSGVVFAFNPANPTDMSMPLSGAQVSVSPGGAQATTASDGTFSFTLAPGTYSLVVTLNGYANNQVSKMVAATQTTTANIGLTSSMGADMVPPSVSIAAPADGTESDLGVVDLQGTASDDRGPISSVKLVLNAAAAVDVPVTNGAFDTQLQLVPGPNSIIVNATDAAGNTQSATATVTFNAGVKGFVFAGMDMSARLPGATAELHENGTGALVSTMTTDMQGNYALTAMVVPADYKLIVRAPGYITHAETVTVGTDKRVELNVSMAEGMDEGDGSAAIAFTDPMEGATVHTDMVTVYGTASSFELLTISINGAQGQALGGGGFSVTVPLNEGPNTLIATATSVTGQTLSGTLHVTRKLIAGNPPQTAFTGGCTATPGLELFALVAMLRALWRRRA
jgi:hypothetical protein